MSLTGPWRPAADGRFGDERRKHSAHDVMLSSPLALERQEDRARLVARVRVMEWAAVGLLLLLLLGFWNLQMVHGARYTELASENQLRNSRVRPARGLILDRHGEILATNTAAYEVALIRELVVDENAALEWLSTIVGYPAATLKARLRKQTDVRRFEPSIVASGLTQAQVVHIKARRREFPGVVVQVSPQRFYPYGKTAAHVLGHVGEISPRQLATWDDRYRMGDVVGQLGVEGVYNDELQGIAGSKLSVVNHVGREVRVLQEKPPEPGRTVILTLDLQLQQRAEQLLQDRRGAIVALDVNNGGVLALASAPAFDPNAFAARFSAQEWQDLVNDPAHPLQDRTLGASLPPGSPFKLVMAIAGLEEGLITPQTTIFCPGGKTLYGRFFRCLGHHGDVNVVQALAYSCNSFFYELGVKLGRERIVRWASRLGFGDVTGIDLPEEQAGIIPSDEWLTKMGYRFYPGETVSISIGQGRLTTSPLQLAHMAATLASGFVRRPHLLFRVEDASVAGRGTRTYSSMAHPAEFSEATRRTVLRGMMGSAQFGTSSRAAQVLPTIRIGGKTGTAQVAGTGNVADENADRPFLLRNHAWFVALAPMDNPEIAITVFLEHGGSGGHDAAPLGGELLAEYFGVDSARIETHELELPDDVGQATDPAHTRTPVPRRSGAVVR